MWFIPTSVHSKPHVIPHEGAYKLGPVLLFRCGLYLLVYLQNPILSPEGAYRVSVTVQMWLMATSIPSRSHDIFHEDAYRLWGQCYCSDMASACHYTFKFPCYLSWKQVHIKVSVTVQMWPLPTIIPSKFHVISHEGAYESAPVLLFSQSILESFVWSSLYLDCI